jgi:hypothetical protein
VVGVSPARLAHDRPISAAEERLARLFAGQLQPPWAIYRSAAWLAKSPGREPADGEADFVIAHPDLGICVVEAKGGRVRRIGPGRWESVDRTGTAHGIKDPFAQVRGEQYGLRRVAEALPEWPSHAVRFCRAVALPDVVYERAWVPDGPREIVIDGDDLERLERRLRHIFDWWAAIPEPEYRGGAPGASGMRALATLLARDIEIPSPLRLAVADAEREIVRLSEPQLRVLDMLRLHRRVLVLGVAGSGKTLLAAEQARRLARQGFRVLLTCFNRPLAEHLRATLARVQRLEVYTFHGLAEALIREAGLPYAPRYAESDFFDRELPERMLDAAGQLPAHRYDAIVVDEAQDLDSDWWIPLTELLADPARGILFVFGDANQDLYHSGTPSEVGVVLPDAPDPLLLEENWRTTQLIHQFAQRFARSTAAAGPMRQVALVAWALGVIIRDGGVAARDVVVLTPRGPGSSWLVSSDLAPVSVGEWRLVPATAHGGAVAPPPTRQNEVRVTTIHRFKGLESPVVVLAEIDGRVPADQLPGLLYVGATRAMGHLVVIASHEVAELAEI